MAGNGCRHPGGEAAVNENGAEQQTFGHCGTGAVETDERPPEAAGREVGRNKLVKEVAGEDVVDIL
jgi:hypothetical protein